MKRKIRVLVLVLAMALGMMMVWNVSAASEEYYQVFDDADLLSDSEEESLNAGINKIISGYDFDVVIVTTNSLDGKSVSEYADDYYDENGFGVGDEGTGLLFLISMEDRDYCVSTHGEAIDAFTDYGIERMKEEVASSLSDGDYAGGCEKFLNVTEDYITAYNEGTPYDSDHPYQESKNYFLRELIALVAAVAVGLVSVLMMKSKMNNAKPQEYAGNYVKKDSFKLTKEKDLFMYSRVTKVKKEKEEKGSSTHTSSSGETHGGGGGKF